MKLTKKQKLIYDWLISKPGYLKKSADKLCEISNLYGSLKDHEIALKEARSDSKKVNILVTNQPNSKDNGIISISKNIKSFGTEYHPKDVAFKEKFNKDNVIFIADLHAPHILDGYLDWCKELQIKYDCGTVIFSGDIIDGGAWNYHEKNPDSLGVKDELYAAKEQLKVAYKLFPKATVLLGNHDLLISRKAKTIGLSQKFIKNLSTILDAPKTWDFVHEYKKDNVLYKHGAIGDAFKAAVESRISTCQGHFHAKSFVQWSVSEKDAIFGLQVGGGFDRDQMAFDYAKPFHKKPIISCGLILDKGHTPIVKIMPL